MRQQLADFQTLVKSPGWVRLAEIAKTQVEVRANNIVSGDLNSLDDMFELGRLKAERAGIQLFLRLPETFIEQLQQDIEDQLREEDNG
jgi:hypothetical protein